LTLLLKQVFSFIKLLNSETGTNQIASGIVFGMILGFTPAFSLQTILVIIFLFFFRIQIGAAMLSAFFFAIPAYLLDPIFHQVGANILENEGLRPLFTTFYTMPIIPFTRFNNSIVMGSGVIAIALAPFTFLAARKLVLLYREQFIARFEKTAFWRVVKATSFYKWYVKYEELCD
jgi:uncharacterized protein (TIGR03546 family)